MTRGVIALAAAGSWSAAPVAAQELALRLGGLHARYADSIVGDAGAIGARLAWHRPRASVVLDASWAQFTTGDGAAQGWGSVTLLGSSGARHAIGVRFDGVANGARGSTWSGTGGAELFGALASGLWTVGAGVSAGTVRTVAARSLGTLGFAVRVRRDLGERTGVTMAVTGTAADTVRYSDATLSADWQGRRWSAGALGGMRFGDLTTRSTWLQAWGSVAITRAMSLDGSIGSYAGDLSGLAHGAFFNAGIRIALWSRTAPAAYPVPSRVTALVAAAASGDLIIEPIDSASTRVTFRVAAGTVAIAGEWNDWTPAPLERDASGRWTGVIAAGAGSHRFALVLDGERWTVPAGVTRLPDDFGGEVGLLIVR